MKMLEYLKKPEIIQENDGSLFKKLIGTFKYFLIYIACIVMVVLFLRLIDSLILVKLFDHSILRQPRLNINKQRYELGVYWFFVSVILGPFIEELLFRLPLRLEKIAISIALSLICYRLLVDHFYTFNFHHVYAYLKIVVAMILFFVTFNYFPESVLVFLRKHYGYYFYFIVMAFALAHLLNFGYFNTGVLLFYPLFILPQFVMGLFTGYLRMNYGFFYAVLLHSLNNLLVELLSNVRG